MTDATCSNCTWTVMPVSEIGLVEPLVKFTNVYGLVVARCISAVFQGV